MAVEKPVDHQRAGLLVHLVLDRLAAHRYFDDDVDLARRIDPDRDGVNAHGWLREALKQSAGRARSPANWSRRTRPCRAIWARTSRNCARPSGRRVRDKTPLPDRCRRAPTPPWSLARSATGRAARR